MDTDYKNIIDAISGEEELIRQLSLIDDIAIIEYDGRNITGSCAIAQYMEENFIDTSVVTRIVLLGKKNTQMAANENHLSELFPNAKITLTNKLWSELEPRTLKICNTLVFHIGMTIGIDDFKYEQVWGNGAQFVDYINKTRVAYFACVLKNRQTSFFENPFIVRANMRLKEFALETEVATCEQTKFCKDKQEYITYCIDTLTPKDAFFQCIEEAEHGCEECNQCGNYGSRKQCPFAQRAIANYYRNGIYVPQDEKIAHQWELMAAKQDFKLARIQVADDLKEGYGCKKNIDDALEIYTSYASQIGNEHCIDQILSLSEEEQNINRAIAIPFISQQAQNGNEDMIIKLSDAFQNAEYGLPKDMVQQKEWIQKGAENGNPRFVLAMAEMYEEHFEWKDAYKWYKTLEEVAPDSLDKEKLNEIELKMLTNGASPYDVAVSGQNYLYGYFGVERDVHLAYRCLKYASDNNVPVAKGLLATMYLEGINVEKDFDVAVELYTAAAKEDDLFSMDKLTDLHYDDDNDYNDGYQWENVLAEKIEDAICNDVPFAYYLKGHYQSTGYQYDDDDYAAFENIKKAAELNVPEAQFELSEMYGSATGCDYDTEQSQYWLKKAADNGYYKAEGKYGIELFNGSSIFNSGKNRSFQYLKKAFEQGYDEAYWCLAQCYMNGNGTSINKELAYPLYQKAAENGIGKAQELLCEKYFRGDNPLPKDYKLCAKWGEEAIMQGRKGVRFETAYSQSHIGNHERAKELYLELANEGNSAAMNNYACELSDSKEKAEWFQKAADNGNYYGMWNIAKYYKNGTGVEKDIEKAIEYFTKSANKGHTDAMMDLAQMYKNGDCVEKNASLAIEWYEKAAQKDKTDATLALAEIYSSEDLGPMDMEKAVHYYKIAAEKDNSTALFKLGEIYEDGLGVIKNTSKAIYWYRKAANKGHYNAKESLKRLKSNWINEKGDIEDSFEDDEYSLF